MAVDFQIGLLPSYALTWIVWFGCSFKSFDQPDGFVQLLYMEKWIINSVILWISWNAVFKLTERYCHFHFFFFFACL